MGWFRTRHLPVIIISIISLLTSLLLANTYGAGLSSIMTIPLFEAPIDTPQQLAEKNWAWGATHDAWISAILDATEPELKKLVSMFQASTFEKLSARRTSGDFCYSVERLQFGHYAVGDYIDEEALNYLRLMNTDIYFEYVVAMWYKTWPMKTLFDLHVLHVVESGIQKYWELQTVASHANSKIQLGISISRQRDKPGLVRLSFDHVSGAFILLGIGLLIASISFVCELLFHKLKRNQTKKSRFQNALKSALKA